jgi:hypothetical protein
MVRHNPSTLPLAPLAVFVPLVIAGELRNGKLLRPLVDGALSARAGGAVRLPWKSRRWPHDPRQRHAELYRPARSDADAPREPLACAALDSHLDAICATRGGDGWLWYAMGIVILLAGGERRFAAVGAGLLAAGLGVAMFLRLKKATGRRRPCAIEPHCWATLLPPDQFSFPSGHTITAFAVSVALSRFYPELATGSAVLRALDCRVADPAGHALPERRAGGRGDRPERRSASVCGAGGGPLGRQKVKRSAPTLAPGRFTGPGSHFLTGLCGPV